MSRCIIAPPLHEVIEDITEHIKHEMERRSFLVSNELRNSALIVLRGQRGGRRYKVPGTHKRQRDKASGKMVNGRYYTASAPGEPPAVRTGAFRGSWRPATHVVFGSYISRIESNCPYAEFLENGTSRMAPRPHQDKILEKATPKAVRIYSQPYF